jgi:hypothetical protein
VFAVELGRRLGEKGIVSTACHPGLITSELGRHTNFVHRAVYVSALAVGRSLRLADMSGTGLGRIPAGEGCAHAAVRCYFS